jgi:uncharacterized membrane protein YfhO
MFFKKIDYYIIGLALITAVMGGLLFYRIAISGYFYISMAGDAFQQYVHFFNMFHDMVRSGEAPFWTWSYGPGGSFWNDFGYYMLGDIFIWPLLLLPKSWFPFSYIPISILKIFLISLGTYLLLKKLGVKRGIALIAGIASSYALFNFEHFYTHYFFLNAAVYFPFILLGYERFLSDKKVGVLFTSLFLASISNFYFLFMITIGLFFYSVFRYFTYEKSEKNLKGFLLFHIKLSCLYLLSLGTAMVIFLPSVLSLFQSNLFHRPDQPILVKILSFDNLIRKLLWQGGMSFLPLLTIPLLFINGFRRHLIFGLMGLALFGMLVVQDISSLVAGFSSPNEFRALFFFNTLFILLTAIALNEIDFKKRRNLFSILLLSGLIYYWLDKNPFTHYAGYVKLIPVIFAFLFVSAQFLNHIWLKRACLSLAALSIIGYSLMLPYSFVTDLLYRSSGGVPGPYHKGVWGVFPLMSYGEYQHYFNNPEVKKSINYLKGDKDLYRTDIQYPGVLVNNSSMSYGYRTYPAYQSLLKWKLQDFEMDYLGQAGGRRLHSLYGFPNDTFVTTILNNKYNISINAPVDNLYGYEPIYQNGKTIIEKNKYFLPIGFLYNSAITSSSFNQSEYPERDELMLRNAVVSKSDFVDSGLPSDLNVSVRSIASISQAVFDEKTTVKKQDNGILVESIEPIELTIPVNHHELSELTVYADILPYTPNEGITIDASTNLEKNYRFEKNMRFNQYKINQYNFTETTNKVLFRFGKDDKINWVKLVIQPGKFLIRDVRVSISDYRDYQAITKDYRKNSLKEIKFGNNYIKGKYSSGNNAILFLSIPYSSGWKASIDGKEVKTFSVHNAYMGVQAPIGTHSVELTYTPEGIILGLILSIVSLCIFLFILIKRKKSV